MAPDASLGGGSQIANQDRGIGDQQLPVPNTSAPTPGDGGDNASERSWP